MRIPVISSSHSTQLRAASLEKFLETLRKTARLEEWSALISGYRLEIERMQGEMLDYLVQGAPADTTA